MEKIQQARRAAFESSVARDWDEHLAHFDRDGDGYVFGDIQAAWWAFNAALDCVVIKLPPAFDDVHNYACYQGGWNDMRGEAVDAIESTNLVVKIK